MAKTGLFFDGFPVRLSMEPSLVWDSGANFGASNSMQAQFTNYSWEENG